MLYQLSYSRSWSGTPIIATMPPWVTVDGHRAKVL